MQVPENPQYAQIGAGLAKERAQSISNVSNKSKNYNSIITTVGILVTHGYYTFVQTYEMVIQPSVTEAPQVMLCMV